MYEDSKDSKEKNQRAFEVEMSRRTFMKTSAMAIMAGTVLPNLVACGDDDGGGDGSYDDGGVATEFDPVAVTEDLVMFPLGVASGAARDTSATFWGFTDDGADSKRLRIWRDSEEPGQVVLVIDVDAPALEGYIKARVTNLMPDTHYSYAFFDVGAGGEMALRSGIGKIQTAFKPSTLEPVTFGASTCTNISNRPFRSLIEMSKEDMNFFVHVGDMAYNDNAHNSTIGADYDTIKEAYRASWIRNLSQEGYQLMRPKCGQYVTWDDHEFLNNWDRDRLDETAFEAGADAYFEIVPNERGEGYKLWDSYRWGKTMEIFILDCRSERQPDTMDTDYPIYIGEEQMAWFKEGLKNSPCHFKVVLNSVPMTQMPQSLWAMVEDRWDGYNIQREEILDFIDDHKIKNVWFISGDFHVGFVSRIAPEREGISRKVRDIAVGPGGNGPNPLAALATRDPKTYEDQVFPEEQFEFYTPGPAHNVMTTLRFDPASNSVHVRFVHTPHADDDGNFNDEVLFDAVLSDDDFE